MLAYAAHRRPAARLHPKTLGLIVAGHAAVLFAVMTARGDLPLPAGFQPTDVFFVDPIVPPPPPPPETNPQPPRATTASHIEQTHPIIETPVINSSAFDPGPSFADPSNGKADVVTPPVLPPVGTPVITPAVKTAARSLTAASDLTPPYPDDKRRAGEEAVIRLSLSIDARGRVVGVTPVGTADPSFVEAARKHILKRWKYKPATEDGSAVASTQTVSIRFRMDG